MSHMPFCGQSFMLLVLQIVRILFCIPILKLAYFTRLSPILI